MTNLSVPIHLSLIPSVRGVREKYVWNRRFYRKAAGGTHPIGWSVEAGVPWL